MRALTASTHKALLQVGDRAVINWVVDPLLAHGVTDLTVVTGYRSDELRAHLGNTYGDSSFEFVHNERDAQTNNRADREGQPSRPQAHVREPAGRSR